MKGISFIVNLNNEHLWIYNKVTIYACFKRYFMVN